MRLSEVMGISYRGRNGVLQLQNKVKENDIWGCLVPLKKQVTSDTLFYSWHSG